MSLNNISDVVDKNKLSDDPLIPKNPRTSILVGLLILVIGFGGFIVWSLFANLDEGVPSHGTVIVDGKRKAVQHLSGGVVQEVLVKEGDWVKKDQVLVRMLDTNAKSQLGIYQKQVEVFDQQIKSLKPLVAEGYYPKNQFLDLERQYTESRLRLSMAKEEAERTDIKAPAEGRVIGLSQLNTGAVVSPGSRLMELVPLEEKLVVEVVIPTYLIDKIVPGLNAEIRFSAFNQRTTPVLFGTVDWVSADRFLDSNNSADPGYYKAKIEISKESINQLSGEHIVVAGMPADVIIKTGHRTFFNYLAKPLSDRAALSFKER